MLNHLSLSAPDNLRLPNVQCNRSLPDSITSRNYWQVNINEKDNYTLQQFLGQRARVSRQKKIKPKCNTLKGAKSKSNASMAQHLELQPCCGYRNPFESVNIFSTNSNSMSNPSYINSIKLHTGPKTIIYFVPSTSQQNTISTN